MVNGTLSECVKFYYYIKLRWAETAINNLISLSKWAWQTVYFPKRGTWFFSICNVWVIKFMLTWKKLIFRGTNTLSLTKIYRADFKPAVYSSQWPFLFFSKGVLAAKSCSKARSTYRKNIINIIIIFWSKNQIQVMEILTFQKERHGTGCFAMPSNWILHGSRVITDVLEQSRHSSKKTKNIVLHNTSHFQFSSSTRFYK